eukprot:12798-Heterococcus_DN1.PRE.2
MLLQCAAAYIALLPLAAGVHLLGTAISLSLAIATRLGYHVTDRNTRCRSCLPPSNSCSQLSLRSHCSSIVLLLAGMTYAAAAAAAAAARMHDWTQYCIKRLLLSLACCSLCNSRASYVGAAEDSTE